MKKPLNRGRRPSPMNSKRKPMLWIGIGLAIISGVILVTHYVKEYRMENVYKGFYEYHDYLNPDEIAVVVENRILEPGKDYRAGGGPVLKDGTLYFPSDFVKGHIDGYLFFEPDSGRLTVTTGTEVYKFNAGSEEYTVNLYSEGRLDAPVLRDGDAALLPASMIESLYDFEIDYNPGAEPNILILTDVYFKGSTNKSYITGKDVRLRYEKGKKAPIYAVIEAEQQVIVYETVRDADDYFVKVRTEGGVIGYVPTDNITGTQTFLPKTRPEDDYAPKVAEDGKIIMTWHYFGTVGQSSQKSEHKMEKGLDVVSPTWFSFDESKMDGSMVVLGNKEYSRWAHSEGLQVWGLVTDNFKYEVSNAVLTVTENREKAVAALVNYCEFFEMDGINIDFEMIRADDIDYFIQFLREMYPLMRERGLVLSVDMYTPSPWNLYYNRTEVAKTCDFVIVMGYDEYWSTAPESGPNASISFVENGITSTLKEVPPEKLILGIPFFVRVWREEPGGITPTSKTYNMEQAYKLFTSNGAEFTWNEQTANYYAEYTAEENGVTVLYRVWLEDERSMEEKLILAQKYGIAGVSSWRKGLEKPAIWNLISNYMKD